jgi:hypothetical protein
MRLSAAVPTTKIFGTVGNHDTYPGDRFPYPDDNYLLLADIWGSH